MNRSFILGALAAGLLAPSAALSQEQHSLIVVNPDRSLYSEYPVFARCPRPTGCVATITCGGQTWYATDAGASNALRGRSAWVAKYQTPISGNKDDPRNRPRVCP